MEQLPHDKGRLINRCTLDTEITLGARGSTPLLVLIDYESGVNIHGLPKPEAHVQQLRRSVGPGQHERFQTLKVLRTRITVEEAHQPEPQSGFRVDDRATRATSR